MLLSHRIRLEPDPAQRDYFARAAGTARRVWNWALGEWQRQYDAGRRPNAMALKKQFNALKYVDPAWLDDDGQPWLKTVHRDSHAQPFKHLERAWKTFFKQVREKVPAHPPVLKRKNRCADSFYVANDKFRLEGLAVVLPKVGRVPLREALRFDGKIMGGTVMREAGNWFLSVQVEVNERQFLRQRGADGVVGVDLGITAAATLSTGEAFASPRPLKAGLRRLRIRSRRNSRKLEAAKAAAGIIGRIPKGTRLPKSNNAVKGYRAVARLHGRIGAIRRDFTHKLTTDLCRKNHTVVIEDLHVKGMLRNRKLAVTQGRGRPRQFPATPLRHRVWGRAPTAAVQGAALRHHGAGCRPVVPQQQAVFGVRGQECRTDAQGADLDLPVWRAPRARSQCGHQFGTARGRNRATRGEFGGDAGHCIRLSVRCSRGSNACQIRVRSARRFGAGRGRCAQVRTSLIAVKRPVGRLGQVYTDQGQALSTIPLVLRFYPH